VCSSDLKNMMNLKKNFFFFFCHGLR